jgi:DNA-binding NarL/FixJ family response regulator
MNLTQKQWQQVLSIIQHLNDSLDDKTIREKAGKELLDLLSADYFASYIWDEDTGKFTNPVFLNMSAENLTLYEQYYQFNDPITYKMQNYRRAVSVSEIMSQKELINTEFFNDFLNKDGLYYGINIYVYDNADSNIGDFRVWRSRKRDQFNQDDTKILDLIAPHFRNAMRNISFAKHSPPSLEIEDISRTLIDKHSITKRELDVAIAILQGKPDKTISNELNISMPTLRTHLQHIYKKLAVNSRTEFCSRILFHNHSI